MVTSGSLSRAANVQGGTMRRHAIRALVASAIAITAAADQAAAAAFEPAMRVDGPLESTYTHFGDRATGVGDVNGDGFDDVTVLNDNRNVDNVTLILGRRTPPANGEGIQLFVPRTEPAGFLAGFLDVAAAGDVDRDGFDDIVVTGTPSVIVYGAPDLSAVPRTAGPRVTTIATGAGFGVSGDTGIGDFDGDGFDDVLLRRGRSSSRLLESGSVILRGGTRLGAIDAWTASSRLIGLTGAKTCPALYYLGIGRCVVAEDEARPVGDVNGDGRDDLSVAARTRHILLGRAGATAISTATISQPAITIPGGSDNGFVGVRIGDTTGDGIDDIGLRRLRGTARMMIVPGSRTASTIDPLTAPAQVLDDGGTAGFPWPGDLQPAGDFTGDGRQDLAVLRGDFEFTNIPGESPADIRLQPGTTPPAATTATALPTIDGLPDLGLITLGAAGDFNGDGRADLVAVSNRKTGSNVQATAHIVLATGETPAPPSQITATKTAETNTDVTVRVTNDGQGAGEVTSLTLPGAGWEKTAGPDAPFPLAPGASATLTLRRGTASGDLVITRDTGAPLRISLAATPTIPSPEAEPYPTEFPRWISTGDAALLARPGELTPASPARRGAVLYPTPVDARELTVEFDAAITDGTGAEGLTIGFADIDQGVMLNALGTGGAGLGFAGLPGAAIALDTWKGRNDPSANFIGLTNGANKNGLTWAKTADPGVTLRGRTTRVKVVSSGGTVVVSIDGVERLRHPVALPSRARLMFTAATGGAYQRHAVSNVVVTAG